jgi:HPt (histidine-containing phosphotransfer) domain-containing protein
MDDYVSKPIDPDHLLTRLEQDPGPADESTVAVAATPACARPFDLDAALKRVRGKRTLLMQMADLFLRDLTGALSDIDLAAAAGDGPRLERTSHRLKGAAITLSAAPVAQTAEQLEKFGRDKDFAQVPDTFRLLKAQAQELAAELQALTGDDK